MKTQLLLVAILSITAVTGIARPLAPDEQVRGWTLLSENESDDMATLAAAPRYHINHIQLSHNIVMNLKDIQDSNQCAMVNRLIDAAHKEGVTEVVLWDHAFYSLDYYPAKFRTGPGGTIDLDNPEFWEWFKNDYRKMLDRVPNADGIVLTFIETGARAEKQYSRKMTTNQEKLAAVVDAVADVVCSERKLNLYARSFSYTYAEYSNIIGAVKLFKNPDTRLMMKETPHDFFLTHPDDFYAGTIARPTLMEFDAAGEFNGENIAAVTWPEYILRRWRDFAKRPHVVGYTARSDRYGATRLVGSPGEINLLTLKRGVEDPNVTAEQIYNEFITDHYGAAALPEVKLAFKNAFDITTSEFYTLGQNVGSHSRMVLDSDPASFTLHVSGKWIEPPIEYVHHDVNREFHYWRDVINHIAPPSFKSPDHHNWDEVHWVLTNGWVNAGEQMDEEYLHYIITEKNYGVKLAEDSVQHIENAKAVLKPADYQQLHDYFEHTLLAARIRRATASAYYGFRVWCRGKEFQTPYVVSSVENGLKEIKEVAALMRNYPDQPPVGQWNWVKDADTADQYFNWIVRDGWPAKTFGSANPNAGMTFKSPDGIDFVKMIDDKSIVLPAPENPQY